MDSIQKDVSDIRAAAFARQSEDNSLDIADLEVDTGVKVRGKGDGFACSLNDIAVGMGMGDNSYPEQNAKQLLERATKKFALHYCIILARKCAMTIGFTGSEVDQFAVNSIGLSLKNGQSIFEIMEDWING